MVPTEQVEHAATGKHAGGQIEARLRSRRIDHAVERLLLAQGRVVGMIGGVDAKAARHGQPVTVHVDGRQVADAGAHQPLQQHQSHEAAADHRHPVAGPGPGVVEPRHHAAHRLDDPALQRNADIGDWERTLGRDVVHGGEAARHHRVTLRHAADAGTDLDDAAHALVTRWCRAADVAAVAVGEQVPRTNAAGRGAHLYLTRSGVGNGHLHEAHPAARLVLDTASLHGCFSSFIAGTDTGGN